MKTFRQFLANEMNSRWINRVVNYSKKEKLPFDNLFGDKLRIVIPYISGTLKDLQDKIQNLSNSQETDPKKKREYSLDLDNKQVITKGITGQGREFTRKESLGAFIQNKLKDEELINWWKKNSEAANLWKNNTKYSIIVSRAPIDVLRMSDYDHLSSCHSMPGTYGSDGSYFQCAIGEARAGGPIAYLVNTEDLEQVPDLQADEIFNDYDRGIRGIVPLARLRIRRIQNKKTNYDLALPSNKTYGRTDPDMVDSVMTWARAAQPEAKKLTPDDMENFVKRGGTYNDSNNDPEDLLQRFFNNDEFSNVRMTDEDDESDIEDEVDDYRREVEDEEEEPEPEADTYDRLRDEASDINDEYEGNFENPMVFGHDVIDDDENSYVSYSGGVNFLYNANLLIQALPEQGSDELKELEKEIHYEVDSHTNDFTVDDVSIYQVHSQVQIITRFDGDSGSAEDFRSYLDNLKHFDERKYTECYNDIWKIMIQNGFFRQHFVHQTGSQLQKHDFQHFSFNYDEEGLDFESELIPVGYWKDMGDAPMHSIADGFVVKEKINRYMSYFQVKLNQAITEYIRNIHFLKKDQPFLPGFNHEIDAHEPENFSKDMLKHYVYFKIDKDMAVHVMIRFILDHEEKEEDVQYTMKYLEYIDKNFDQVVKLCQKVWQWIQTATATSLAIGR